MIAMYYIIITGILVGATAYGVWRRYNRNNEDNFENIYSEEFEIEEEAGENLAIL